MKHITEYSYENGHDFNGFRVHILKKGIEFRKYVPCRLIGRDEALKRAIQIEAELAKELKNLKSIDEIIEFKKTWG